MKKYLALMLVMLAGCAISGMPDGATITNDPPMVGDFAYVKAEFQNPNYSAGSRQTATNSPSFTREFVGTVVGTKQVGRLVENDGKLDIEFATIYAVNHGDTTYFVTSKEMIKKVMVAEPNGGFTPDPALRGRTGP